MNKVIRQSAPMALRVADVLAKLRDCFKFQVPVGYQDDRGFHYGAEPAKKQIAWPPA
jgi:hypothetical protein